MQIYIGAETSLESPWLSLSRKGKQDYVSTCELKLELLREYVAARESLKAAQLECREMRLSESKEGIAV